MIIWDEYIMMPLRQKVFNTAGHDRYLVKTYNILLNSNFATQIWNGVEFRVVGSQGILSAGWSIGKMVRA